MENTLHIIRRTICWTAVSAVAAITLACTPQNAHAQLGSASAFGVLGASTVTNTGNSTIYLDLGVAPGTSITGFPPGSVLGTTHDDDAVAMLAQADALTGYTYFAGLAPTQDLTGQNLGGLTLTPGVYKYDSSAQLTGQLELNFLGLSNQDIVFQIGSTLTTASASSVITENMGLNDNVFWQVGSSATLGTTTMFYGNVIAEASDTLTTGATDPCGGIYALTAAVTLDDNTIGGGCPAVSVGGSTPEPSASVFITCLIVVGVGEAARRKRRAA